jgi:hypothetical protein
MSRINQYVVATATFSVALGIGFVMQNGDALAARFSEAPSTAMPDVQQVAVVAPAVVRPAPREGTAAWMVRQKIDTGVTEAILAAAAARAAVPETVAPEAEVVLAAATKVEEAAPVMTAPAMEIAPVAAMGAVDPVVPMLPEAPVLQAALETDAVPDVPAPMPEAVPEAVSEAPSCEVTLTAVAMPAALVDLTLDAPCSPSARAAIHHQGMTFTIVTDDAGQARTTVPALAEGAVFMADLGDAGGAVAAVTVPELAGFDRAVLQWQGTVGPEIHALEFGAGYGEPGHVWHGAPRGPDVALAGTGGFLMRLGDGLGLNPHMAEVYTFPSGTTQQSGMVQFTVETPVTEATCGRDLTAQTIQVSPGAEPFAFDLTMAVPDCEFTGEILVLRDMILDLTVVAAR